MNKMYLLDTNALSELKKIKSNKINLGFKRWLSTISIDDLYTSEVVLMEIERGILNLLRKDPVQSQLIRDWFEQEVKIKFSGRIFGINRQTSAICASLHVPYIRAENDMWIASTAIAHSLILVTRNIKDFENLPVRTFNPFHDE